MTTAYADYLRQAPLKDLLTSHAENLRLYFEPSSAIGYQHVMIERIPWRRFFDVLFSAPILPLLLIVAGFDALRQSYRAGRLQNVRGLCLPGFYVFLVCVLFEKAENMRFKFFLEPILLVFLVARANVAVTGWLKRRATT